MPIDTYGQRRHRRPGQGLHRLELVACPDWPDNNCFNNGSGNSGSDPDRGFKPMLGYPQYHATSRRRPSSAQWSPRRPSPSPDASLKPAALDALAAHPNVGPFIGKQLIQRLVTSNPSPAYVSAVAAAFNGQRQRRARRHEGHGQAPC